MVSPKILNSFAIRNKLHFNILKYKLVPLNCNNIIYLSNKNSLGEDKRLKRLLP